MIFRPAKNLRRYVRTGNYIAASGGRSIGGLVLGCAAFFGA